MFPHPLIPGNVSCQTQFTSKAKGRKEGFSPELPFSSYSSKWVRSSSNYCLLPSLILLCLSVVPITSVQPAFAHQVKVTENVGGTLHIEPNDNPRAGEPTQAWFALTRKGGRIIPLPECNCHLSVYAEPHTPSEPPLLEPSLQPITAERYQGTPGAEITFPKPGVYELRLSGKPAKGASFKPFEFKFEVTVASGKVLEAPQSAENATQADNTPAIKVGREQPLILLAILILFTGTLFLIVQGVRRS